MGTKFFRSLIAGLSVMLSFSTITFATDYVHQVIIANEGYNDFNTGQQLVPVTVATYDPSSKVYSVFDTIEGARFATEVIIDGDFIFVAADMLLVKYDRFTLQHLDEQTVPGIRNIAVWNDKILVTRGEYLVDFNSYFQVYNTSDLSLDYELDTLSGPKYTTQNIAVVGDRAYILVNNGFDFPNYKGLIGVVDLVSEAYVNEFDLESDGLNPDNLMRDGNMLYTLNNKDFSGSSVSVFDMTAESLVTTNLPNVSTGCGTSTFFVGNVWYQHYGSDKIYAFDPISLQVVDSSALNPVLFYGLEVDPVNNYLYGTTTDFVSTGMAYIYDEANALLDSFVVGVSAGSIAFDVRKVSGINERQASNIKIYPNPAIDYLQVEGLEFEVERVEVIELNGKVLLKETSLNDSILSLNIRNLVPGMYYLSVNGKNGEKAVVKFIR